MKWKAWLLASLTGLCAAAQAAAPPAPWAFGMSPSQVRTVIEGAPYQSFSNGDLESFSAVFDGHPENFQFFFEADRLRRIGIYFYEGTSATDAAAKWLAVQSWLAMNVGPVRSVGNVAATSGDAQRFVQEAIRVAESGGKTQLLPNQQPADARIFASFMGAPVGSGRNYLVVLYFDRPPEAH